MVVIATPTRGQIEAATATDIAYLMRHSPDTEWFVGFGSIIANNRTMLVHNATKAGASHILFVDSDMRIPHNTLEVLLAHDKDIVGINFKQRTRDEYTARKNDKFISSKGKTGLEEIDTLGFGATLIKMSVFTSELRGMPPDCFSQPFDTRVGLFVGEDVYFFTIAKERGYKVWVDHDLSKEAKHIGQTELGID